MITAEEFFDNNTNGFLDRNDCEKLMIEFAKLHVTQALKQASEKVVFKILFHFGNIEEIDNSIEDCMGNLNVIDKDSILNVYPLTNIK